MKCYSISYDLIKPGQNYDSLLAHLRQLGAERILASQWGLKSTRPAEQIRNDLRRFLDGNDRLLVAGLTGEAAWANLLVGHDDFRRLIAA